MALNSLYTEDDLICPVLMDRIDDNNALLLSDGIIYSADVLLSWLDKNNRSPKTNVILDNKYTVKPNFFTKLINNQVFSYLDFTCPITKKIFYEPVIFYGDGYVYEKEYLKKWIKTFKTSPTTGDVYTTSFFSYSYLFNNIFNNFLKNINLNEYRMYKPCMVKKLTIAEEGYIDIIFTNDKNRDYYDGISIDVSKIDIFNIIKNISNTGMLKYLIDHISNINQIINDVPNRRDLDIDDNYTYVYLDEHYDNDCNIINLNLQLIFILLTYNAPIDVIKHIISRPDFDYNVIDVEDNHPLHLVCMSKNLDSTIYKAFIDNTINLDLINIEDNRPIDIIRNKYNNSKIEKYLIMKGASPYVANIRNIRPLTYNESRKILQQKLIIEINRYGYKNGLNEPPMFGMRF